MSGSQSAQPATWPIPDPPTLFNQAAVVYETNPALEGIDARSAYSVASTNCRVVAMTGYDLYLMQANLAQELMPDTAQVWLPRDGNIWNVPQLQPTPATGNAIFTAPAALAIPAGVVMTFATFLFVTTAASAVPTGGGSVSIPVVSVLAGSAYNLPPGTTLQLVNPIAGLVPQSATLDSNGLANGTDLETNDAWRKRILAKIRQPPNGGSFSDYDEWATAAGASYVNVVGGAVGAGSVGIYIAAAANGAPAAASDQLVTAVQNYIGVYGGTPNGVRPVTARAVVAAFTLVPVNITLHLNPDTTQTRAGATAALALFFAQNAVLSGQLAYLSRINNAISDGDGEFSHELIAPTADVSCTPSQLLVLGTVTFE